MSPPPPALCTEEGRHIPWPTEPSVNVPHALRPQDRRQARDHRRVDPTDWLEGETVLRSVSVEVSRSLDGAIKETRFRWDLHGGSAAAARQILQLLLASLSNGQSVTSPINWPTKRISTPHPGPVDSQISCSRRSLAFRLNATYCDLEQSLRSGVHVVGVFGSWL